MTIAKVTLNVLDLPEVKRLVDALERIKHQVYADYEDEDERIADIRGVLEQL